MSCKTLTRHSSQAVPASPAVFLPASTDTAAVYYYLSSPVVLVTKGRGREEFNDSRPLFRRLDQIALHRETVMQINNRVHAVNPAGIAALNAMLETHGLVTFYRAAKRQDGPARRLWTRFQWNFLGEYLGWEFTAL